MRSFSFFIITAILLTSCKEEDVRVDLLNSYSNSVEFELDFDEVVNFYADIDIEYKEKPDLIYHCAFLRNGEPIFDGGVDALVTTDNLYDTLFVENGITHQKFYGKLKGNLTGERYGIYSVKTRLIKNNHPDLKINKADIVFVR
tara:strand:- start:1430 stop:1861 length:432 start_codon:yes stop_codon:yes gene_type:complete